MPQDHGGDGKAGCAARVRAALLRAAIGAALVGVAAGLNTSAARAEDDGAGDDSVLSKFMVSLGLRKPPDPAPDIKYSERSPLVVPPTRDLPPPSADLPPPPDWPNEPPGKPHKHAKAKPAAPATSAAPAGQTAQTDPSQPARVPNPTVEKASIWNPKTWFSREEYATFSEEPAREDLTDPPAGYRVPSPNQPYGVGPDKTKPKTAADSAPPHPVSSDIPR